MIQSKEMLFDGIRVIVYQRADNTVGMRPAVIFLHSGGWVGGHPRE